MGASHADSQGNGGRTDPHVRRCREADRADAELPEKIDTERDAELLRKFNLDPQQLADGLGGQAPAIG
jgi:hypothetical protein